MSVEKIKKLPLFTRILYRIKAYRGDFIRKSREIRSSPDYKSFLGMLGDIVVLGILISLTLIPFGIAFKPIYVLSFGAGFWLLRDKVVPIIVSIFSSIRLVSLR